MKFIYQLLTALLILLTSTTSIYAQGSLTPPGPPAATMKTLAQVEARTIVNATNTPGDKDNLFVISTPGSYYLTGNITGVSGKSGILINANNVTLDLNGFALIGVAGTGDGIVVVGVHGAFVRNGSLEGWEGDGLDGDSGSNCQYEHLRLAFNGGFGIEVGFGNVLTDVSAQGNTENGIAVGVGCTLTKCSAITNTIDGISAGPLSTIIGCTAKGNGDYGINTFGDSTIKDCTAGNNNRDGIRAGSHSSIVNCTANGNSQGAISGFSGIDASSHSLVKNCVASSNNGNGITVSGDSYVLQNQCSNNTINGIVATGSINRIDGNHTNYNGGVGIQAGSDWVVRNTSSNNTHGNFAPATGPDIGPIQTASTATNPFANLQ